MRIIYLTFVLLITCPNLFSQTAVTMRLHGGSLLDKFNDVAATADSGYIAVGTTASFGSSADIYLVKCDRDGIVQWSRAFGGGGIESGEAIAVAADTGYFVTGYSNSYGNGGYDAILAYLDSSGFIQWIKSVGDADWDFAYDIALFSGSVILCGETYDSSNGGTDAKIIQTDLSGNISWIKKIGGTSDDAFHSICRTYDGNFATAGYSISDTSRKDAYLVKWDLNGDTLFTKTFGDSLNEAGNIVIEHSLDSGLIVGGYSESFSAIQNKEVFLVKCDSSGNLVWTRITGQSAGDMACQSICEIDNYELLLSGYTPVGAGGSDAMIYIATYDGWWTPSSPTYGGIYDEFIQASVITADKKYIFAGYTESYGAGSTDAMIIEADSIGQMYSFQMVSGSNNLVSINELKEIELKLFPNPADDFIRYSLSSMKMKLNQYRIYNLFGELVATDKLSNTSGHIDISFLPSGQYLIVFSSDNSAIYLSDKIIIY